MLFADLYVESINLDVANVRAARRNDDKEKADTFLDHLIATLTYCSKHGLVLDNSYTPGIEWTLRRTGYTPSNLHILLEGREGFEYYVRPEPNRHTRRRIYIDHQEKWKKLCSYDPCGSGEPSYGLHDMY